jgi:hypothetical protein
LLLLISGALVSGVVRRRGSEGVRREEGRMWEEISGRGARSGVRWRDWVPAYTSDWRWVLKGVWQWAWHHVRREKMGRRGRTAYHPPTSHQWVKWKWHSAVWRKIHHMGRRRCTSAVLRRKRGVVNGGRGVVWGRG